MRVDPRTHTLVREGVPSITNPLDLHAIEAALQIRERLGGKVLAISMGPPQAVESLKEAVSMGVDDVVLLSDRRFAGADTLATSYSLAKAIEKLSPFDLVICGSHSQDAETGHVGPQVAFFLSIPHITHVAQVASVSEEMIRVHRAVEDGYDVLEARLPCLITVVREIGTPRVPSVRGLLRARKLSVPVWSADDVGAREDMIGLRGSPTQVTEVFTPGEMGRGRACEFLSGPPEVCVAMLLERLRERKLIQ